MILHLMKKIAQYHPDGTIDYVLPSDRHESYSDEMIVVKKQLYRFESHP